MTVEAGNTEKKQVPLWAVAVAGVALLAFLIWWGAKAFGPTDYAKTSQQLEREGQWDALVKKTGGDMRKMTQDEKKKYFSETGPGAQPIWDSYSRKNGFKK